MPTKNPFAEALRRQLGEFATVDPVDRCGVRYNVKLDDYALASARSAAYDAMRRSVELSIDPPDWANTVTAVPVQWTFRNGVSERVSEFIKAIPAADPVGDLSDAVIEAPTDDQIDKFMED